MTTSENKKMLPDPNRISLPEVINISQELERSGEALDAVKLLRTWLQVNPNSSLSFAGWYELGRTLQNLKQYSKAEASFRAAIEQKPTLFEAHVALGKTLESQGKKEEAINVWLSALPIEKIQIELLNNIARVQESTSNLVKIEETLLRSLRLDSQQDDVLTTLLQVRQKLCRWPVISQELPATLSRQRECVGPLMSLALFDDPKVSLRSARTFLKSKDLLTKSKSPFEPSTIRNEKIHVAFLSADIRLHATSVFFSPLLTLFDRKAFTVSILDLTTTPEAFPEFRENLINNVDRHILLNNLNDSEAVQICRSLNIDILIDLAGLTSGARPRIVSERIAPVQIGYIGFLSSTGIPDLDYVISTEDLFPKTTGAFSERPLMLNGPYLVMDKDPGTAEFVSRTQLGISESAFVFGALLNSYKINNQLFSAWMEILHKTRDSILWLVEDNDISKMNLLNTAAKLGVEKERLIFSKRVHPALYRNQLKLCDIFLDAFPYGSGATARDAIHANLPILTKPGSTMMSRLSSHMMSQLGIVDLIAQNVEEYIDKAVHIANNRDLSGALRMKMKSLKNDSNLFNQEKFVEEFYRVILNAYESVKK